MSIDEKYQVLDAVSAMREDVTDMKATLKERERQSEFIKKMILSALGMALIGFVILITDHAKLQEIIPQNTEMWNNFQRNTK